MTKKKLSVSISEEAREMLKSAADAHGVSVSEEMEQAVRSLLQAAALATTISDKVSSKSRASGLGKRNPLSVPSIPQSEWDKTFEELEPHVCEDGTVLKRYRLVNFGGAPIKDGPISTQVRTLVMDEWQWSQQFWASNKQYSATADEVGTARGY